MSDIASQAAARKRRSEERLRSLGLPVDEDLPPFPSDVALRSPTEVVRRARALWAVGMHAETMPRVRALEILEAAGCSDALSPREAVFLERDHPGPNSAVFYLRRYECLSVLLWHLGHLPNADQLDRPGDIGQMLRVMVTSELEDLAEEFGPRSLSEVLDLADLVYRCHHALLTHSPPGFDPHLAALRLKALYWLLGVGGEWDEIQPDD